MTEKIFFDILTFSMQNQSFIRVLKAYGESTRRFRWWFVSVFAAYGVATFGGGVLAPLVYRRIIDTVSQEAERSTLAPDLFRSFWMLVFLTVGYHLFYRAGDFSITYAQSKTMEDLNNRAFAAYMRQGYAFFTDRFAGSLVAQARRFANGFEDIQDTIIFNFWMPLVQLVGILGSLFIVEWRLAVIFLVWIPLYIIIVVWMTKKKLPYDTKSAAQDSAITASLSDAIANIFAVKTFAAEANETETFRDAAAKDREARFKAWRFNNILIAIQTTLFGILELLAMYAAIRLWLSGSISAGTVVLVQIYIASIFGNIFGLGRAFGRLMRKVADASEMIETLDRTDVERVSLKEKVSGSASARGEVSFEEVDFEYPKGGRVFENFSLSIRAGEKVGLVGVSGSGKSTLTKLLLRFVLPDMGSVSIDGRDIGKLPVQELRHLIAYVPQDTALFHRSIAENIAYGRPDASQEEIEAAAKKAHAHDFILALPNGYDTLVGERGVKLSGGERQRIAIARAILKDAPILVLDEATSALDTTSEHHIQEALRELMSGRTTIVIAHRLSTVREMDRIVVLENGRIAEGGSHSELLEKNGIYAGFWNRQTASFGTALIDADDESERGI